MQYLFRSTLKQRHKSFQTQPQNDPKIEPRNDPKTEPQIDPTYMSQVAWET